MNSAVFIKTPKGVQEIETKANGLSTIERWVLIYIDGKRTLEDLKTLPRVNDLHGIITMLEGAGYITPLNGASASSTPLPASPVVTPVATPAVSQPAPTTSASIFRELPATFDSAKFGMAKNFMINTLNTFQGFYGVTALVRKLDHCQTHEELRSLYDEWYSAIIGTRQGLKQERTLREKLLAVL